MAVHFLQSHFCYCNILLLCRSHTRIVIIIINKNYYIIIFIIFSLCANITVRCVLATDLYTFDADIASAQATFSEVCDSYVRIFTRLGLPFVQGIVIF